MTTEQVYDYHVLAEYFDWFKLPIYKVFTLYQKPSERAKGAQWYTTKQNKDDKEKQTQ